MVESRCGEMLARRITTKKNTAVVRIADQSEGSFSKPCEGIVFQDVGAQCYGLRISRKKVSTGQSCGGLPRSGTSDKDMCMHGRHRADGDGRRGLRVVPGGGAE